MTRRQARIHALDLASHTLVSHDWPFVLEEFGDADGEKVKAELYRLGRELGQQAALLAGRRVKGNADA